MGMDAITYGAARAYVNKQIQKLGTGFRYKGEVATVADLPLTADAGDCYIVRADHHMYCYFGGVWSVRTDANSWGEIYGDIKNQADLQAALGFEYTQSSASADWEIEHGLNRFPNVTVVDSAGTEWVGAVEYVNKNKLILHFNSAFSGKAYLS